MRWRPVRLLTGLWTVTATAFAALALPECYLLTPVGPLSRQQVCDLSSTWAWLMVGLGLIGVIGLDREIRAGRWLCMMALAMATIELLAFPMIGPYANLARAYSRLALVVVPNLVAIALLGRAVRPW
jgi:hypothetical protein